MSVRFAAAGGAAALSTSAALFFVSSPDYGPILAGAIVTSLAAILSLGFVARRLGISPGGILAIAASLVAFAIAALSLLRLAR